MGLIDTFNRILRHGELFETMVTKLGLQPGLARLPHVADVKRRAVNRCISCSNPDGCESWLDKATANDMPPDFCRNHDMLVRLKQVTEPVA